MRVVINAQLDPSRSGGIAQVLLGLAHGLGQLAGPEEYLFVCSPASADWLRPYLGKNQSIHVNTGITPTASRTVASRTAASRTTTAGGGVRHSDGFWESFEPDVLHFPYQSYTDTSLPTVFNPHDLQHVHLPQFFSDEEITRRELLYGQACRLADAVVVASRCVKQDIVRHYGIAEAKVHVITWGSPTSVPHHGRVAEVNAKQIREVLDRYRLAPGFAIYPAQTWPHKNHLRLLEAIAIARDRYGVSIELVCTGSKTEHFSRIEEKLSDAKLNTLHEQVRFIGHVTQMELLALYRAAKFVVVPSLFEAVSFCVYEAFAEGVPVACSNIVPIMEQAGGAALMFDPYDPDAIARGCVRLVRDHQLCDELVKRGKRRMAEHTWHKTATAYRQVYRVLKQ